MELLRKDLVDYRCSYCSKLLYKGHFIGKIDIMCNRCKKVNTIKTNVEVLEAL